VRALGRDRVRRPGAAERSHGVSAVSVGNAYAVGAGNPGGAAHRIGRGAGATGQEKGC
jgi:hypothetical protein